MPAQQVNYREIDKNNYIIFYDKAKSFYDAMQNEYEFENWPAVGLNAVHCVISANDALLVKRKGIYCSAKEHLKTVDLLTQNIIDKDLKQASNHLRKVIALKNTIEYEAKPFTKKMAETINIHTTKFFQWVSVLLKKD